MSTEKICETCDKVFYKKTRYFCSRKCYLEAVKRGWNDQWAGENHPCYGKPKPLEVRQKISKSLMGEKNPNYGKPKSGKTLKKMKEAQAGEKHYNWKDGITEENLRIRNSNEYRRWRITVYRRDHYTCVRCLNKGGKLIAHHILSFARFPEERFKLDNGATLCTGCHGWMRKNELSA